MNQFYGKHLYDTADMTNAIKHPSRNAIAHAIEISMVIFKKLCFALINSL